jgi:hypothetical protein
VVAALDRSFRIDQDIGDVLDVADLADALAHFEQWVVARGPCIGRIE